jgi:hypothetical protein
MNPRIRQSTYIMKHRSVQLGRHLHDERSHPEEEYELLTLNVHQDFSEGAEIKPLEFQEECLFDSEG